VTRVAKDTFLCKTFILKYGNPYVSVPSSEANVLGADRRDLDRLDGEQLLLLLVVVVVFTAGLRSLVDLYPLNVVVVVVEACSEKVIE
jgi:hypothetical protein